VLLHGYVKGDKIGEYNIQLFRLESPVHVKPFISISMEDKQLKDMNTIIDDFSKIDENKNKDFKIDDYVQIMF